MRRREASPLEVRESSKDASEGRKQRKNGPRMKNQTSRQGFDGLPGKSLQLLGSQRVSWSG